MHKATQMTFNLTHQQEGPGKLHELVRDIADCHDASYYFSVTSNKHVPMIGNVTNGIE